MKQIPQRLFFSILITCLITRTAQSEEKGILLFQKQIRPLIEKKCLECHNAKRSRGGLDLSTRKAMLEGGNHGPAFLAESPQKSLLLQKVAQLKMPPKDPLAPDQIQLIRTWIMQGAKYAGTPLTQGKQRTDTLWSLQPIQRPTIPLVNEDTRSRNPIDRFVQHRLHDKGLSLSPEADRVTLIRRLTYDLHGLPPTPTEIDAFVNDSDPQAYEKLVDRLLASPRYGERWARHWLDVVRFAESHGYETNKLRFNAWPYRDYVIRAFNRDIPYPQFILEQLAGDTLANADRLTQAATGFLVGGAHDVVGNQSLEGRLQQRVDDLDDMITATSATFLGLTVNCARCHDHKFDPITQQDYYQLQAIFAGVQHEERAVRSASDAEQIQLAFNARKNVEKFKPIRAKYVRFSIERTNTGSEPCIDELEIFTAGADSSNVALATAGAKVIASSEYVNNPKHKIVHLNDGQYGNGRSWISRTPGTGWAQIEFADEFVIDRIVWGRDREGQYADRLPIKYRIEVATKLDDWQVVVNATRTPMTNTAQNKIYAGQFRQPGATQVLLRGDPQRKAEAVAPASLSAIKQSFALPANAKETQRRIALAQWLADKHNPLPARVMVNRLWHYHFGQGIVSTPSDFGINGGKPSHPKLLDWLTKSFMDNGWQLKPLHRLIVTSATYRQQSRNRSDAKSIDSQNRLLWRMNPRRLEAEAIRDTVLALSGQLDLKMGGPGYNIWQKNTNYVTVFTPKEILGPNEFRRMIYQFKARSQQDPVFGVFDCPDAALARPRRTVSTTVLQALNLLNSRFLLQQSKLFAQRVEREVGKEHSTQVERIFQLAFGRNPTPLEQRGCEQLVKSHGLALLCRTILNANELLYID